jgi:two-component sensor histidine kinase
MCRIWRYAHGVHSLDDVVRSHTDLPEEDQEWLHRLVAEWQLLADLCFADLVLWVTDRDLRGYWVGAQMRPTTGPTAHVEDLVGTYSRVGERPLVDQAFTQGRICREGDPELRDSVPPRFEAIPVRRTGQVLGVITRTTTARSLRTPSRLELTYLDTAANLAQMICEGRFPPPGDPVDLDSSPRVGDGLIRLDTKGVVSYASPNAQSGYRRLGLSDDLIGRHLGMATTSLAPPSARPVAEAMTVQLSGRMPRQVEVENAAATLNFRVIPLVAKRTHVGALVLLRDVTDLRRRERELLTKDATIREIHHRVKNNLQTVAALLRLQARRVGPGDARAALEDSVRRVGSIAIVHETLSQGFDEHVDFDQVADRLLSMVVEMSVADARVTTRRLGDFGMLQSETATPLALVITEVVQNAAQHGLGGAGGTIELTVERGPAMRRNGGKDGGESLRVAVADNGKGLPEGFDVETTGRLGLQIVRTLVESELGGRFSIGPVTDGPGTQAVIDLPQRC